MKIKDLLNNKNISENENYLILSSLLNLSKPELILNKERNLTKKEYKKYIKYEKKLEKYLPVQYVLKKTEFYGNNFFVNKNVLIPRPETEALIEKTQYYIKNKFKTDNIKILDIGTGSGIIAITLKKLNQNSIIIATDISKKALKVAKKNSKLNKVKINYKKTNLFDNIEEKFDVIISNPPYIDPKSNHIETKVKINEPNIALYADEEGCYYYRKILEKANKSIKKNHIIAFEIGESQKDKLIEISKQYFPNDQIISEKDYNNFDRYLFIISK